MQDLIIYDKDNVIVQSEGKVYQDTTINFITDYGEKVNYQTVDYNRTTQTCWLNGEAFQAYPNTICEDILNSIDTLLEKQGKREYILPTLDELKDIKLSEVDAWTAYKITGGFISQCTGNPVRYDSDRDTQNTVSSDLNTIYLSPEKFNENFPNGYPMRGYPENTNIKQVYFLTKEQLLQWNVDLGLHRGTCKQNGWIKQAEVNAAQSKEELDAIILD
ncbi:hypothetical protein [Phascolarctobacterium faecium]|uniref:hypothetical protein n=1 Tax=Phascolarctobacterium faecium TaxID=33025 RepID=UPI003078E4EF